MTSSSNFSCAYAGAQEKSCKKCLLPLLLPSVSHSLSWLLKTSAPVNNPHIESSFNQREFMMAGAWHGNIGWITEAWRLSLRFSRVQSREPRGRFSLRLTNSQEIPFLPHGKSITKSLIRDKTKRMILSRSTRIIVNYNYFRQPFYGGFLKKYRI